jgi:hypothetical protein
LAGGAVDPHGGPVALPLDALVGDRPLDHEDKRIELALLGLVKGPHELVAVLVRQHLIV